MFVLQDVGISHSEGSDESADSDADSDNFSVEFEVESIDSDAYSENDEDSLPGENEVSTQTPVLFRERLSEDLTNLTCLTVLNSLQLYLLIQVYEVTIFAEDEDLFDEDTEITQAVRNIFSTWCFS